MYGDAEDPELPAALPLREARWVISAVRTVEANVAVTRHLRDAGYHGSIAVVAHTDAEADRLMAAGADVAVNIFRTSARPIVSQVGQPGRPGGAPDRRPDETTTRQPRP